MARPLPPLGLRRGIRLADRCRARDLHHHGRRLPDDRARGADASPVVALAIGGASGWCGASQCSSPAGSPRRRSCSPSTGVSRGRGRGRGRWSSREIGTAVAVAAGSSLPVGVLVGVVLGVGCRRSPRTAPPATDASGRGPTAGERLAATGSSPRLRAPAGGAAHSRPHRRRRPRVVLRRPGPRPSGLVARRGWHRVTHSPRATAGGARSARSGGPPGDRQRDPGP